VKSSKFKIVTALALTLVIAACAKERTSTYEDPRAQTIQGRDSITTNSKPVNQDQVEPTASPSPSQPEAMNPYEFIDVISSRYDGNDAQKIYESLDVSEVSVEKPEEVICEYVPQTRLKKTLGRLDCLKMFPTGKDDPTNTTYTCKVIMTKNDPSGDYDQNVFHALTIAEVLNPHGYRGYTTYTKEIGRFHCDRLIEETTGKTSFECGAHMLMGTQKSQ
jgi:hypothetical protein